MHEDCCDLRCFQRYLCSVRCRRPARFLRQHCAATARFEPQFLRDKGYRCSATLFMFTVVELSGLSFRSALHTYRQAACNNAPAPWELLFSPCLGVEPLSRSGIVNFCLSFVEGNTALSKCRHFLVMDLKLLLSFYENVVVTTRRKVRAVCGRKEGEVNAPFRVLDNCSSCS
jgi:hypothetical protein